MEFLRFFFRRCLFFLTDFVVFFTTFHSQYDTVIMRQWKYEDYLSFYLSYLAYTRNGKKYDSRWYNQKTDQKITQNFTMMKRCDLCDRQLLNKFAVNYLKSFRAAWHGSENVVSIHRSKNQWRSIPFLSTKSSETKPKFYCCDVKSFFLIQFWYWNVIYLHRIIRSWEPPSKQPIQTAVKYWVWPSYFTWNIQHENLPGIRTIQKVRPTIFIASVNGLSHTCHSTFNQQITRPEHRQFISHSCKSLRIMSLLSVYKLRVCVQKYTHMVKEYNKNHPVHIQQLTGMH